MRVDDLDGLHELVREAARSPWDRGDFAAAVHAGWAAVWQALPAGDVRFVEPSSPAADGIQAGIDQMLRSMAHLNTAADAFAADSPHAAFELLAGLSLCARFVERSVSLELVDRVLAACLTAPADSAGARVEQIVADVPRPARAIVVAYLADALVRAGATPLPGTRAVYLRLVEAHADCAATAAARCTELLARPRSPAARGDDAEPLRARPPRRDRSGRDPRPAGA